MQPEQHLDPASRYEPDMLVVDTQHRRLITKLLGDRSRLEDQDDDLGLTLIKLPEPSVAARRAEELARERGLEVQVAPPDEVGTALDALLANLRAIFRHDYGGWEPAMGKNRTMTGIQFVPYPNVAPPPPPASLSGPRPLPRRARGGTAVHERPVDGAAGQDVLVGLLDTRLYRHSRLANRYVAEPQSLLPLTPPQSKGWPYVEGHATFIGGLILDRAPSARLSVRSAFQVESADPSGWDKPIWNVAREMMQYLHDGAQILNCSWACYTEDGRPPFVLERALAVLTPKLLVVAAAGNHGQFWSKKKGEDGEKEDKKYREKNMLPARDAPAYPAALPNVVAVGASGPDGPATFNPIAWGTGAGKERIAALAPWINVLAPGVAVRGPYFGDEREEEVRVPDEAPYAVREQTYRTKEFNGEAEWSGTSFAAATVTGAIAARIRHGVTAREALDELLGEGEPGIGRADT